MQQLAQALELPIKAPSNDLRVIVDEKLRAMDRKPLNTPVVVDLKEEGIEYLSLQVEKVNFCIFPPFLSLDSHKPPRNSQEETKEAEL